MKRQLAAAVVCILFSPCVLLLAPTPAFGQSQSNAGDLAGMVIDPEGARVPGATVTVRNLATNFTRSTTTDAEGSYQLLALPPGFYEVTVESSGFATTQNPSVQVLIGQRATLEVGLQLRTGLETVVVTSDTQLVETQRTAVASTVTPRLIQNLPINQRDYLNFTLLDSMASRDAAPSIGAAPTSGINFNGQRARSNLVTVDGADATDNSVNGVRSTVSQEAVQEFQIVTSSYMPEFGRAGGGVVNIVTKGGTNDIHGNVFGFLRHDSLQARNPFSTESNPAFTRVQAGVTVGGPIVKDKSFFFLSYETRQRHETGFSSIGQDNFGFITVPTGFGNQLLTPQQASFLSTLPGGLATSVGAALTIVAGAGSGTGVNGTNAFSGPFFLSCPGAPAPPCRPVSQLDQFVPLSSLIGNYPVSEDTHFFTGRVDANIGEDHSFFARFSYTPSDINGIQVNAQNQTFGQNAASRTSIQKFDDYTVVSQLQSTLGTAWVNQFRFQYARRALTYDFAQFPGGDQVAINIGGFAFFGREPFSSIDRIEDRWQFSDNITWAKGRHTFKAGADFNRLSIDPRGGNQIFQLNFGGLYNFGALPSENFVLSVLLAPPFSLPLGTAQTLVAAAQATSTTGRLPALNAVQAYGLGFPQIFLQGLGDSNSPFSMNTFGWYVQDSWRAHSNLTINYGIRFDVEFTPVFRPGGPSVNDGGSALIGQAEEFLGVLEGLRRDKNNFSPRVGLAWDPWGSGKTVVRAAYGVFFDHPLLALAFNSNTADGSQSVQQFVPLGTPSTTSPLFSAASVFQGIQLAAPGFGYIPTEGRFDPFLSNSTFINLNFCPQPSPDPARVCGGGIAPLPILPWTLPTQADFDYAYSQQANLTIEREVTGDFSISVGYNFNKGTHLNRPRNINATDPNLLTLNFLAARAAGLNPADPRFFALPTASTANFIVVVPGLFGIVTGTGTSFDGAPVGQPFAFNYFRPSGPNLAFTGPLGVPDASVAALIAAANAQLTAIGNPLRWPTGPGFFIPFSDVNQQESSGRSTYHGITTNFRKRFSHNHEFLASYTLSHAIDDSTDLQTLLNPANNRRPDLERGNSSFDIRHRFVFSGVFQSPYRMRDEGFVKKFFADWVFAPIVELSTGRPFSVLAGSDNNFDFGSSTDRPNVATSGAAGSVSSPFLPGQSFTSPGLSGDGNLHGTLGRNTFNRPRIAIVDFRISRRFRIGERVSVDWINDFFNIFNRFNVADINPLCDGLVGGTCIAGQPTAAFDPRQYQLGVRLNW